MAAFFALKYAYMRPVLRVSAPTDNLHRLPFYIILSLLMLAILHGASVLKVVCILSINYAIAKATGGTRLAIPAAWIFNGGVLLANEWYEGYTFETLHSGLAFLVRPESTFSYDFLMIPVT
jgi:protein-cysteine N-palmitoyltransferase HHAT